MVCECWPGEQLSQWREGCQTEQQALAPEPALSPHERDPGETWSSLAFLMAWLVAGGRRAELPWQQLQLQSCGVDWSGGECDP